MRGGSRILKNQVQERDSVKKKNQISSETNETLHCKKPNSLKLFSLFLTCEMILRGCINQIALAPFSLTNGNFTNGWRISHNKRGTMYPDIVQFSQPEKTAWVWTHIVHLHEDELQENMSKGETCCGLRKEKGYWLLTWDWHGGEKIRRVRAVTEARLTSSTPTHKSSFLSHKMPVKRRTQTVNWKAQSQCQHCDPDQKHTTPSLPCLLCHCSKGKESKQKK